MTHTRIVEIIDAIPGLDITEFYYQPNDHEHTMPYDPAPKIEARRRWKKFFGLLIAAFFIAILTTITEVHATPDWKPETPATPATVPNVTVDNKNKVDSTNTNTSGSTSTAGSVAGATSGSTAGASSGSTANSGPSVSGATSSTGAITVTPVLNGGSPNTTAGATANSGPVVVSPTTEMNSSTSTRALALSFPAPIAGTASSHNCLVAGNNGMAIGFNFFSTTKPTAFSDPICTLRAMAAEADQACQFRTAAEMRSEAMAIVLKREPRPVADTVQDLSPEQCMLLKQPRIVMPQTNTTYVDASQWQTQDVQPPTAVQSQQSTPTPRPRPRPTPTPTPTPALPTCGAGETSQCVPAKPAPGSFSEGLIRR